jgi:hypothetical protein
MKEAEKLAIPASPEAITPEWLTDALRAGGAIDAASVTSFDAQTIGAGAGFLGVLARLDLRYDRDERNAPRSLIAKMPTLDLGGREIGNLFRFYEREVRFYEQVAERVEMRVPRAYYRDVIPETGDFVLLLEDMAPACVGDQVNGCTPEQARLAIHDLAQFQAGWWTHADLEKLDWMPFINDPVNQSAEQSYQQAWPAFVEFLGDKLPADSRRVGDRLGSNVIAILNEMSDRPQTIVHGDYRLDNLFFASENGGPPLAVVDWQIANRGIGTFDVGYFLSGNIDVKLRSSCEMDFLKLYHDTLLAGGVKGYSWDDCLRDYRSSVLFCLVYVVISIGTIDPANDRGLALMHAWFDRVSNAIRDLRADELLPG